MPSETPTRPDANEANAHDAPSTWRTRLAVVVGIASSALFLYLAGAQLRWQDIRTALSAATPWPWIPLAMATYLAGHWVRGVRCRDLVRRAALLSVPTATNVVVVGYAANNLLPARAGELVRAGMLAERAGIGVSQALTVTALERVLDGLTIVGLLLVVALSLPLSDTVSSALTLGGLVFGLASLGVVLIVLAPSLLVRLLPRVAGRIRSSWRAPALRVALGVAAGVEALRGWRGIAVATTTSIVIWLLEAGMFLLVLPVVGLEAHLGWAILAMAITNLGILVPASPGFIGTFEYFCAQALALVGVSAGVGVAYAILVHLVFFVPITLWGVAVLGWYGISVGKTAARAAQARHVEGRALRGQVPVTVVSTAPPRQRARREEASMLIRALSEASLGGVDGGTASADEVGRFVQGQLDALPPHMRALLRVGLSGFSFIVFLQTQRPFSALPLAKRQAVFASWAYGRVGLARQLMRPIRSTALLAYYDLGSGSDAR